MMQTKNADAGGSSDDDMQGPLADPETLATIRKMMEQDTAAEQPTPQNVPSRAATAHPKRRRKADALPALADPEPAPVQKQRRSVRKAPKQRKTDISTGVRSRALSASARMLYRVRDFRPSRRQVVWSLVAICVLLRPWLVVGLFALTLMALAGSYLILGYDGFWGRVLSGFQWFARRAPDRAARVRRRLDRFAMRWDAVLDRFPEGWVDGLYLPDFHGMAEADRRHTEAMDARLEQLRES
ncbi:hypothetical protein [Sulfitobacter sabulilitoris]|uniref:Uncharacterized protein n=1 Tax=Sulfitobacter sabulilitoris TaxID=2562655 RepID=A0A5S3P9N8_9RHOB|nr:hypothetical protein [Sulfitobacter sabulilitoris]TMM49257.1 hypothetical protein FDT80_18535 [Sulfitobacter sabulilitoris]